ncbi:dephospho-CoA kinase [Ignavibacteria bacterium 4148-Me]|uniref:dephospho-CoA kinase n=1 Tax=Rosettibacter primus TaxID=3111523 RepID=UPI00336BBAD3
MKKKLLIGITGGIGAGKSIVSSILESMGYCVLKSDLVAKEIMQNNNEVKKKIIETFGEEAYSNGKLNTKYLAEKVFSSKENVEKINSIVHPFTIKKNLEQAKKEFQKSDIVFIESPLIYEAKIQKYFDYVILIYSDEQSRIKRVMERDKVTEEKVRQRMQFQIPDEKKKDWVDFVIENNSNIEELKNRLNFVMQLIKSI